jgi:hypothetical protein
MKNKKTGIVTKLIDFESLSSDEKKKIIISYF